VAPQDDRPDLSSAPGRHFVASDERAHAPDADNWWEAWQLDLATEDGVGVAVRLACAPKRGVAWWWTHVLLPDRPRPIVVRDHEVPLPRVGLEVRADGLWGELVCETPFEHWTFGLEAFGVALDNPSESLVGEIGERMPIGFDLEWEVDETVGDIRDEPDDAMQGYAQFGVVHGELLFGRSRVEIAATGRRVHSWGVPGCAQPRASYWMRGPGVAESARYAVPVGCRRLGWFVVPLPGAGRLTRALCRFDAGIGWSSAYEPE
jgi:hypothetical protein